MAENSTEVIGRLHAPPKELGFGAADAVAGERERKEATDA